MIKEDESEDTETKDEVEDENEIKISDLSEFHKRDKDTVLEIIKKTPEEFKYVSYKIKGYDEIVKVALSLDGKLLKNLNEYGKIYEYCMIAVKQNGLVIKYCCETLKENSSIAKEAVKNNCNSYQFIGKKLKNNKSIALIATKKNISLMKWIGTALKKNTDFIDSIIKIRGFNLKYTNKKIRTNDRCKEAILYNVNNYEHACESVKNDKTVIDDVLVRNIKMFQFVPNNIRNERDFVLKWIKKCKGYNILRDVNYNTIKTLIAFEEVHNYIDRHLNINIKINDVEKNDCIKLITSNPSAYNNFSNKIKRDVDITNIFISRFDDPEFIARSIPFKKIDLSMYQICKVLKVCDGFRLPNSEFIKHIRKTLSKQSYLYDNKFFYDRWSKDFLWEFEYYLGNEIDFPNSCFDMNIIYDGNKIKNHFTEGNDSKRRKFI